MNNKPRLLILLSTALCYLALNTACKKEHKNLQQERLVTAGASSRACSTPGSCGDSTLTGVINSDLNLRSCKIYKLSGLVYITNNATVTIEAGTLIKGVKSSAAFIPGGGLIVTRGAKLIAVGTVDCPIIFTSNEPNPASGDWSGVVLIGKAPANLSSAALVEGIPPTPPADATYGGPANNIPNDNSGILKYVRIEYAGFELSTDNELNGLTLAGVGNGTTIDYVEVYKAADDAFQFFGGTVNASHLLAIDPLDELIETTNGYQGTINYALGIIDPSRADKSISHGIESTNNVGGSTAVPNTRVTLRNATIVGLLTQTAASITNGLPSGVGRYGRAARLIKNTEFAIDRSLFLGFNYGIILDPSTKAKFDLGTSTLSYNFVHAYVTPYAVETPTGLISFNPGPTNIGYVTPNPNLNIQLANPFGTPRVISNFIPTALSPTRAYGAFPTGNTTWANVWTKL